MEDECFTAVAVNFVVGECNATGALAIAAPAALGLLTMLTRFRLSTFDTIAVCDSLFDVGGCLFQTLTAAGFAGQIVFGVVFPTDIGRVAFALFAVAVVAESVVLGMLFEKLAARPGIAGCVLKRPIEFEVVESLG